MYVTSLILANITDGGEFMGFKGKPVIMYDYEGLFLKYYSSVKNASISEKINKDYIYTSISRKIGANGKRFFYYKEGFSYKITPYNPCKPVYQYKRTGKFIKKWRSVEEAATELNIDRGSIRKNIYGQHEHAGNFIWSHIEISFKKEIFEIGQYDLQNNFIRSFENAGKAQTATNIYNASILLCCKNKMKSAGNFIWKFKKVEE